MTTAHQVGDWRFWRNWGLAFVSFPLGGLAALSVAGGIETAWDGVLGGLAGGVQWLALRSYLHLSPAWVAATSVGMAAGLALSTALLGIDTIGNTLLLRGALTGLSIGTAQCVLLIHFVTTTTSDHRGYAAACPSTYFTVQ